MSIMSIMSIQQQFDELMEGARQYAPAEAFDVLDRTHRDLVASGQFDRALKVGDRAPSFRLRNVSGAEIDSQDFIKQGPVVISFYRGAWCPFCNIELKALQDVFPEIKRYGANLVAISPEKPDYSADLIDKHSLAFDVLTDTGNHLAEQFGIVFTLDGDYRTVSEETFGADLPNFNGDDSWQLPAPATFIVDKEGVIRFAFVDVEFRHRAEPEAILEVLGTL